MSIVIRSDHGTQLPGDFQVRVKVRSEHTGGVMAVIEETVPPRRLISPHTHQNDVWGVRAVRGSWNPRWR